MIADHGGGDCVDIEAGQIVFHGSLKIIGPVGYLQTGIVEYDIDIHTKAVDLFQHALDSIEVIKLRGNGLHFDTESPCFFSYFSRVRKITTVQDQIIEDTLDQMGQSTWLN